MPQSNLAAGMLVAVFFFFFDKSECTVLDLKTCLWVVSAVEMVLEMTFLKMFQFSLSLFSLLVRLPFNLNPSCYEQTYFFIFCVTLSNHVRF